MRADASAALHLYSRAAEAGSPAAQTWLAEALKTGRGVIADVDAAIAWYVRAARSGHVQALNGLTDLVLERPTTPEAQAEVIRLWLEPARAGNAAAQRNLGRLLLRGVGGTASPVEAVLWLQKAAAQGDEPAKQVLSESSHEL